jgi:hypothetical protein
MWRVGGLMKGRCIDCKQLKRFMYATPICSECLEKLEITMSNELDQTIRQEIKKLHQIKDEMNQVLRKINNVPGLKIRVEILKSTTINDKPGIVGIEISIMQEIYP